MVETVRADRYLIENGKSKRGVLAILVNSNPCHIMVREWICCPDIELLAVWLRPYYLPREILHAIVVAVYIPPSGNSKSASSVIHNITSQWQTIHPNAIITILGDFNHITTEKTWPTFTKYLNCPTREESTLDLMYANVKNAYGSSPSLHWLGQTTIWCTSAPVIGIWLRASL